MIRLAALALLLAGCGERTHWQWSSEAGYRCFAGCKGQRNACVKVCGAPDQCGDREDCRRVKGCFTSCGEQEDGCLRACPDVQLAGQVHRNESGIFTDEDCRNKGYCARGACRAVAGRCVP